MSWVYFSLLVPFLLWPLLAVAGAGYVLFAYAVAAWAARRHPGYHASFKTIVRELATTVLVGLLLPLQIFKPRALVVEDDGLRRPVILLHGFAMNHTNWVWLARFLRRRKLGPVYRTSYFSYQDIRRSAAHLQRFVERVCDKEQAQQVDIVAHSLGGIVTQVYLQNMDGARRVRRVIAIGTPFAGTLWARIGILPMARDMCADSIFLGDLRPQLTSNLWYSIWSTADAVVIPPESARLPAPAPSVEFSDLGHLSMLFSLRVAAQVVSWLEAKP